MRVGRKAPISFEKACKYEFPREATPAPDPVNHPRHYTGHPSGVECITVVETMGFNLGNAVKYIWRADLKGNAIEDLKKAAWYVQREIARRSKGTLPAWTPSKPLGQK